MSKRVKPILKAKQAACSGSHWCDAAYTRPACCGPGASSYNCSWSGTLCSSPTPSPGTPTPPPAPGPTPSGPTPTPVVPTPATPTPTPDESGYAVASNVGWDYDTKQGGCGFLYQAGAAFNKNYWPSGGIPDPSNPVYKNTPCKRCYKLTGAPDKFTPAVATKNGNNAKSGWSQIIKVVDKLPNPSTDQSLTGGLTHMFDLSQPIFTAGAKNPPSGTGGGHIPVYYQKVDCPPDI